MAQDCRKSEIRSTSPGCRLTLLAPPSTYFPQRDIRIRIFNCRNPSVRVDFQEWFFLYLRELDELCRVGDSELLQHDDDLVRVGPGGYGSSPNQL